MSWRKGRTRVRLGTASHCLSPSVPAVSSPHLAYGVGDKTGAIVPLALVSQSELQCLLSTGCTNIPANSSKTTFRRKRRKRQGWGGGGRMERWRVGGGWLAGWDWERWEVSRSHMGMNLVAGGWKSFCTGLGKLGGGILEFRSEETDFILKTRRLDGHLCLWFWTQNKYDLCSGGFMRVIALRNLGTSSYC